jgi:ABC-type iron transport system FetAB ATPase subunit
VEKQSVAFCDCLSVGLDLMDNGKTKLFTFPSGAGKSPTLLHYVRKVTVKASFFSSLSPS